MKKQLTAEQKAKAEERKAQFRDLWKRVSAMPELERIQLSNRLGLVTCEGRALSLTNQMLIALQRPGATVLGGFRQWLKQGRAVRKGEHGAMIWVPCGVKGGADASASPEGTGDAGEGSDVRFIVGTVFDIGQTEELTENAAA